MKIAFEKVVPGATHFAIDARRATDGIQWYLLSEGRPYSFWSGSFDDGSWVVGVGFHERPAPSLFEAPKAPAWQPGDTLPPVGTVCEVMNTEMSRPEWEKCTILYLGKHRVMYDSESCFERVGFISDLKFRAIKTPEQIEREAEDARRDKAQQDQINGVAALRELMGGMTHHHLARKLYKAGVRAPEVE